MSPSQWTTPTIESVAAGRRHCSQGSFTRAGQLQNEHCRPARELTVLEALVKSMREKYARLEAAFLAFLFDSAEFQLAHVELRLIEHAAAAGGVRKRTPTTTARMRPTAGNLIAICVSDGRLIVIDSFGETLAPLRAVISPC